MKIAQIAGFLGSGKTTALMKIVDGLTARGHKIAIVVNDVGDISVDARFIEAHGLKAKEISGGCICCQIAGSFAETLAKLHDTFDPDIIIVEPSGVAIPLGLKRAAEYSEAKTVVHIEHAPVITLVDSTRIDLMLKAVKRLVETQIREADICFINKVDAATAEQISKSEVAIREMNPTAEIKRMSAVTGEGIDYAVDQIENGTSARYDDSMEAKRLELEYNNQGGQ
ncbi:CobW family GTP-binding protein [Candidatus Methanoprimaticola sp. MG2]|uniref:CobW family GTP-binding protein n=1 Tax=Candidatus Methanoprimaticola sp. MG2 TaxID=3228838 RepID=UPI0039C6F931